MVNEGQADWTTAQVTVMVRRVRREEQSRREDTPEPGGYGSRRLFYISYAHNDRDEYLDEFVAALDREIRALTGSRDELIFFDRVRLASGENYSSKTLEALGASRVLIAIISPSYFNSRWCGKEWQLFVDRARRAYISTPGILPVIWVPVRGDLPFAVRQIQLAGADFPENYSLKGLRHLARMRRQRDDYHEVLHQLGRRLIQLGETASRSTEVPDLGIVPSAFEEVEPGVPPRMDTSDKGAAAELQGNILKPLGRDSLTDDQFADRSARATQRTQETAPLNEARVPGGTCAITIQIFSGSREPIPPTEEVLITLRSGAEKQIFRNYVKTSSFTLADLPFHNNFGDNYTVVAWARGRQQVGYTPVKVTPDVPAFVDLMLPKEDEVYNFSQAGWDSIRKSPVYETLLTAGVNGEATARDRYEDLMENRPAVLACLFNLTTAMAAIRLASGTPLDYLKELIWDDTMRQDRFFAWADRNLVDQVVGAAAGLFAPVLLPGLLSPGSTRSFKQIQFGEANLRLTFYADDKRTIAGVECIKVETDIDYYKDPAAHALLEVETYNLTSAATDPRQVYVLRWMASRKPGIPAFEPPYTLE